MHAYSARNPCMHCLSVSFSKRIQDKVFMHIEHWDVYVKYHIMHFCIYCSRCIESFSLSELIQNRDSFMRLLFHTDAIRKRCRANLECGRS